MAPTEKQVRLGPHDGLSKVLMGRSVCLQFMDELLPNDGDLMRRSWHSIPRELRGR